jgi:dTDP-4-amino-4,6-dideoxygalactose transaminase
MNSFIPFAIPDIGEEEINEVIDTLKSGWITTGPKVQRFEKDFAEFIGCKHALAVNSATAGLHLALDAIGLKKGDRVITTPYTFTATAEVVRYFDANVIFSDINPQTYNLCPDLLEKTLERECSQPDHNVKAIIPVHMAGQACEMDRISKLAKKYDLKVIEDAAHALPTTSNGKLIGTLSDITVFSFYATKTLATAEGGMVCFKDESYAKRIKVMRLHGFDRDAWDRYNTNQASWAYGVVAPGYKYNMTDISASMGIHQLAKMTKFHKRRVEIAQKYNQAFKELKGVQIPFIQNPNDKHAYHLYIIQVEAKKRDSLIEKMKEKGVGCSVHFIPLHIQPYWKEQYQLKESDFPISYDSFQKSISLPIYTKMSDEQVNKVISSLKLALEEF